MALPGTTTRTFNELNSVDAPRYLATDHPLYERKPVTDLWNKLTSTAELQLKWNGVVNKRDVIWLGRKSRLLQISGPPGSGKSSAVYAWAHRTCRLSGYSVAWIDAAANKTDDSRCWFMRRRGDDQVVDTERTDAAQVEASIAIFDRVIEGFPACEVCGGGVEDLLPILTDLYYATEATAVGNLIQVFFKPGTDSNNV